MYSRWPRLLTPTQLSQIIKGQKNPLRAFQIFNEAKSRYPNYRHNGAVYATMISILGTSGHILDMKKVIDQMKEDSCECRDSLFANAIRTYANAGMLDEAISLFRNLPKFNCVNWTESFNTLLQIMIKERKLEATHDLFLDSTYRWEVKSRIHSLNLLIDALCKSSRSDLALHVLQEMNYQCCYPNRGTYQILMKGLCDDGRLNEATHLLYSMFCRISQKGAGEDVIIYRTLLNALCDNGEVQEAVEILGKILKKGLKAPKRCLKQLDRDQFWAVQDTKRVKDLFSKALIKGGIPSLNGYGAMAIDLYSEGNIDQANDVLEEMQDRGFKPPVSIYEAKVAALCREGRAGEAVEVFERELIGANCVPSVKLHNTLIKGLCQEKKTELAIGYLTKMSWQAGCVPNEETYSILVDRLCQDGLYAEASQILEKMLINSYLPTVDTFNSLICGLCIIGKHYEAIMWLEEMISQAKTPDPSVWGSLVSSVCSETALDKVLLKMIERLRNSY